MPSLRTVRADSGRRRAATTTSTWPAKATTRATTTQRASAWPWAVRRASFVVSVNRVPRWRTWYRTAATSTAGTASETNPGRRLVESAKYTTRATPRARKPPREKVKKSVNSSKVRPLDTRPRSQAGRLARDAASTVTGIAMTTIAASTFQ